MPATDGSSRFTYVAQALGEWLLDGNSVELWESNKLTVSDRRILITQWIGRAVEKIDSDIENRTGLFEKTGLAMTADGSDDNVIRLEGMTQGTYSFMDVDTTPESQEGVLPISPAPADEEHPPGSSDEDERDKEEEAGREGKRLRRDVDEMAILDVDDELADDKVPLPLQIPGGYSLVSSEPAILTTALVNQSIMLRLGVGLLKGIIT